MGKFVMSLALLIMMAGTAFLVAAPVLVKAEHSTLLSRGETCFTRGIVCR
ncbi:hypothetical protein EDC22_10347 [Tepidamorphus gemmatus]|jgi:hypothetical protein|uniref:Uncharacterized protein n=1 Tax=Tepidamorphus gemmatus TaxID=747076 RepID=A0A4R3MH82_9HYPH|nr:hypothetical protein [Tepidamorphus gemmatus]TCT11737.1 hypothetical protein EDC22_10347 [Tepidamorphus gemmatus]